MNDKVLKIIRLLERIASWAFLLVAILALCTGKALSDVDTTVLLCLLISSYFNRIGKREHRVDAMKTD